jgi:hypothetical protein
MLEATKLAVCMALVVASCGGDVDDGRQSATAGSGASHTGAGGTGGAGGNQMVQACEMNGTGLLWLKNSSSTVHYIVLDGASFAEMAPGDILEVDLAAGRHSVEYHWGGDYQIECTRTVTLEVCGFESINCESP